MSTAIKFENISKQYRLGLVSTRTISHDLNRWWKMNVMGKEDPYLKIGEVNDRAHKGESEYVWALKDINFEVEQGDVLGIIGKNGAGKSTLLKILSKVTAPTTGTIKAAGRIASLLEVGTGFHPEMTGRENIFMNGAIMGMTKSEISRKLDEIVDFSGVERYLDTPVKRYSSGMTVRLGFAIAAHLEPEILVVDEVLAVGDAEFQKKAIGKMQDVSRGQGRTVLFVSHNMAAVKSLCNKGVLLEDGMVKEIGKTDLIVDKYISIPYQDLKLIKDNISFCNEEFYIENISINNQVNNSIEIDNNFNKICLKIIGFVKSRKEVDVEIKIFDINKILVASYFPSLLNKSKIHIINQNFEIYEEFHLPQNLTSGNYNMDIFLTKMNIEGYIDIYDAIKISVINKYKDNGQPISYNQYGYFFI